MHLLPNTDDMRELPSFPLVTGLSAFVARIRAYDPVGVEHAAVVVIDLRNVFPAVEMIDHGFHYQSIGRIRDELRRA
jgi:UDP-glucose 6-dehydrogenase